MKKPTKKKTAKKTNAKKKTAAKKPAAKKKLAVKKAKAPKAAAPDTRTNERIGIFGGAFNPIHVGHLNAAMSVKMEMELDRVIFVPLNKAPHREITGPSPQDRFMLVDAAIQSYKPELAVDDIEIKRGGVSFTVDTLTAYNETHKPENIYFIMGADAFKGLTTWRDFAKLLKLANFVVVSRPGSEVSLFEGDISPELQAVTKSSDGRVLTLKTKREISSLELDDVNASSTDIRKRLRSGGDAKNMVPPQVLDIINEKGFYKRSVPAVKDYRQFSFFCADQALDRKALSLKVYDMTGMSSYADYSVICSATSSRHASSVAQNIVDKVKEEFGIGPLSFEGAREGMWVLIDYGAVVIHVFEDSVRGQYRIEELWKKCPQIQAGGKASNSASLSN